MNIEDIKITESECHLCLSSKNIELCKLENCNYPMCKTCKNNYVF